MSSRPRSTSASLADDVEGERETGAPGGGVAETAREKASTGLSATSKGERKGILIRYPKTMVQVARLSIYLEDVPPRRHRPWLAPDLGLSAISAVENDPG